MREYRSQGAPSAHPLILSRRQRSPQLNRRENDRKDGLRGGRGHIFPCPRGGKGLIVGRVQVGEVVVHVNWADGGPSPQLVAVSLVICDVQRVVAPDGVPKELEGPH